MRAMILQRFVKLTGYMPLRLFCGLRLIGKENMPRSPCILVANHGSMLDPVLLQIMFPMKQVSFLCAPKLFCCPRICQSFLRAMGAVPIIDGISELKILKKRADEAEANNIFGFFSQGTISHTQSTFMPGATMLAMETGLPLVPVFIHSAPFYKGGSWIRIGKAVEVEKTETINKKKVEVITQHIRSRVYELSITTKEGRDLQ